MNQIDNTVGGQTETVWAPLPATLTGAADLRTSLPAAAATGCPIQIGGHSPIFLPDVIADAGVVRIGGHSPTF